MQITLLKSKIHRATVTDADLSYEGSISIDTKLMLEADLHLYERVEVYNINNGARFATYVIEGGDGEITLNGAAARHVQKNDLVIIACYGIFNEEEAKEYKPKLVFVDENNKRKELPVK
jgi:aspartate 1-decarboxylase